MMASNKDFTVEELRKMHEDLIKEAETIGEMLKQKEEEEKERKQAQLALEKEKRTKEVDEAYENYCKLVKAYIKDYGRYSQTTKSDWYPSLFQSTFF